MRIKTKIICTIGPSVKEKISELINAGMNVARLNFSHGSHPEHREVIHSIKHIRKELKVPISILLDTKGPEIRVGTLLKEPLLLQEKDEVRIVSEAKTEREIPIHPFSVLENIKKGMTILFDDGYIASHVIEKGKNHLLIRIENAGVLKSHKGINIPDADINLPALTEQDILDITFGCKEGIDMIAASFVRSADHVLAIKKLLSDLNCSDVLVIAKIENKKGMEAFDAIVEVADGIMVARGDLGVELNLSSLPRLQKKMIARTNKALKPVITATQMLESMIQNPRPTRAEVSDVANAIYDFTSCVMLSGETAVGRYPLLVVRQMKSIVEEAEGDIDYRQYFDKASSDSSFYDVSSSVAIAAVKTAYSARAKAIFIYTSSGFTARLVSRFRPEVPIIALTNDEKTYHQLALYWGVLPLFASSVKDTDEAFCIMSHFAFDEKIVDFGDLIVMTTGTPFGKKGSTNLMTVESIGHVLVRGYKGVGEKIEGDLSFLLTLEKKNPKDFVGKILVIPRCDDSYYPFLEKAKGVILQNNTGDTVSEKKALSFGEKLKISVIVRAENALSLLKDKESVVIDPKKGLIYKKEARKKNGFILRD